MRKKQRWDQTEYNGRVIEYQLDGRLVTELRCGERSAHISPGLIFNDEIYIGSYTDDFHGGPQGSLTKMVEWLTEGVPPKHSANCSRLNGECRSMHCPTCGEIWHGGGPCPAVSRNSPSK